MCFKVLLGKEKFRDCWQVRADPGCAGGRAFTDQPSLDIFYFSLLTVDFVGARWDSLEQSL